MAGIAMTSGVMNTIENIGTGTNINDVSDMLDLWAHKSTPFLNRLTWGADSGGLSIEWVSEHLGFGYVHSGAAITSDDTEFVVNTSGTGLETAEVGKQIEPGTLFYAHNSGVADAFFLATANAGAGTITISMLSASSSEIAAGTNLYLLGRTANEGSEPTADTSRNRTMLSNNFTILRKDINITGSMLGTDMYAVQNELAHQTAMRLLEMQFNRERHTLYSTTTARSAANTSQMHGCYGFLNSLTSPDWVDTSTTVLTEPAVNNLVAECWDNGGEPDIFVGNKDQIRKFTGWASDRIRTKVDDRIGGAYIYSYLTDVGVEIDLVPLKKAPTNLAFVLDSSNLKLRAKNGRKLIREQLGKAGDYDRWQMISEYSLEMTGYDKGYHGMFTDLT